MPHVLGMHHLYVYFKILHLFDHSSTFSAPPRYYPSFIIFGTDSVSCMGEAWNQCYGCIWATVCTCMCDWYNGLYHKIPQYKEGCTYMTVHVRDVTCVQCGTTCDVCVHFKTYNNYKFEGKRNKIFECCHFLCLCPGGGVGRSSGWNWRVH